jgi:hypothetical protein
VLNVEGALEEAAKAQAHKSFELQKACDELEQLNLTLHQVNLTLHLLEQLNPTQVIL